MLGVQYSQQIIKRNSRCNLVVQGVSSAWIKNGIVLNSSNTQARRKNNFKSFRYRDWLRVNLSHAEIYRGSNKLIEILTERLKMIPGSYRTLQLRDCRPSSLTKPRRVG